MSKKIIVPILMGMALFSLNGFSQKQGQERIDSLFTELSQPSTDTQRVKLLTEISTSYYTIKPDSGVMYGSMALDLARKIRWEKGIGSALRWRGINYMSMTKLPEALDDYLNAMKIYEKAGDLKTLAGILSNIGAVYGYQQKEEKALEYFFKALNINRKVSPKSYFEAANLGNIGAIYTIQRDYAKGLEFTLQSIDILRKIPEGPQILPTNLANAGNILIEMGDYSRALPYIHEAMTIASETGDENNIAVCRNYQGRAILGLLMEKNTRFLDTAYGGNKQAALQEARALITQSIATLSELGDQNMLSSGYENLVKLEEYQGNFKEALAYHKKFKAIEDSIFTTDNSDKLTQFAMQYEFDKKEAANLAEQEKQNTRQRNIRNSIALGLAGTLMFLVVVSRQRNRVRREKKNVEKEKARSEELLLNILPEEVADELKKTGTAEAKLINQATVLFTDFKGFTAMSENLSPKELVNELHECFTTFDHIIHKHGLEKIKTIGDAYMAAGGLPTPNDTHPVDVVLAALEISRYMEENKERKKAKNLPYFEVRIGVHTGPVVAGIVGVKKFSYDIWGDTVNTASRLESSGEVGQVNISETTYSLVKEQFTCISRGKISAKGKGEIEMYFVQA